MKKKNYIEPSVIIKNVRIDSLLQTVSGGGNTTNPLPGDGGEAGEDDGSDARQNLSINDVWED